MEELTLVIYLLSKSAVTPQQNKRNSKEKLDWCKNVLSQIPRSQGPVRVPTDASGFHDFNFHSIKKLTSASNNFYCTLIIALSGKHGIGKHLNVYVC
jgi:hypothetical protein